MAAEQSGSSSAWMITSNSESHILRLPVETLEAVFQYAQPNDLANLSRVCKTFHQLASVLLFRVVEHVFAENPTNASDITALDRFTNTLTTLLVNKHDYAKFVKHISIGDMKLERTGNTATDKTSRIEEKLLNMTLRAIVMWVPALESFRWNTRMELSQALLQGVSKMPNLQNLHIRLIGPMHQAAAGGPPTPGQFYQTVPGLNYIQMYPPYQNAGNSHSHATSASQFSGYTQPEASSSKKSLGNVGLSESHKMPTFSLFSSLRSLAVLNMDSIDYVPELAQCVSSCSSLRTLKVSFADRQAWKTRLRLKKAEAQAQPPPPGGVNVDGNGDVIPPTPMLAPAVLAALFIPVAPPSANDVVLSAADIRQDRHAQETALAQILGVDKMRAAFVGAADGDAPSGNTTNLMGGKKNEHDNTSVQSGSSSHHNAATTELDATVSAVVGIEVPDVVDGDSGDDQEFIFDDTPECEYHEESDSDVKKDKGKAPVRDLRTGHGIPLENLYIGAIPVTAEVLIQGIDFSVLKHLSLVGVGVQNHVWSALHKLNKDSPLSLESLHTDNASPQFAWFVTRLNKVTELFMIEHNDQLRSTEKSSLGMHDIYTALYKHRMHLKRLMIRNDTDSSWCLTADCITLITSRECQLVELTAGLNSTEFHHLMNCIRGLRSLVALQILFHIPSNCVITMSEVRACLLGNIFQFPQLSVKYAAVCFWEDVHTFNSVDQFVKESIPGRPEGTNYHGRPRNLRMTLKENLKPYEISEIKMWTTEIWGSRL